MKIAKGSWRIQIAVYDPHHARTNWESSHASCFFESVTKPVDLAQSNQSTPYYEHVTAPIWSTCPDLKFPTTEEGALIQAAIAGLDEYDTIERALPTDALQTCFSGVVNSVFPGSDSLEANDRAILESFCLHKKLNQETLNLLRASQLKEAALQPDESGDPLKGKFTQYSPNS